MSNYFNLKEFEEIFKLSKVNPLLAKERFEEYLERYPKDYVTHIFYAGLLIKMHKLDEAEEILNNVEIAALNDSGYRNSSDKKKYLMRSLVVTRLKLLLYQGDYSGFYQLYNENYPLVNEIINRNGTIVVYCENELGILGSNEEIRSSYIYKQIVSYSEEEFLEHMKRHIADYAVNMEEASRSIFVPDFPIYEVIEEIKKYIPSDRCIYPGFYEDEYVFKYDECGRDDYRMTDYFKVYAFHNARKFITMTPAVNCEKLPFIDLNYLKKEKTSKVRRLSQIEKFNNKYNK